MPCPVLASASTDCFFLARTIEPEPRQIAYKLDSASYQLRTNSRAMIGRIAVFTRGHSPADDFLCQKNLALYDRHPFIVFAAYQVIGAFLANIPPRRIEYRCGLCSAFTFTESLPAWVADF